MYGRRLLFAEAWQQVGQEQRARDAGQATRYHRHRVAEGGCDRSGRQVSDARTAGDHNATRWRSA